MKISQAEVFVKNKVSEVFLDSDSLFLQFHEGGVTVTDRDDHTFYPYGSIDKVEYNRGE